VKGVPPGSPRSLPAAVASNGMDNRSEVREFLTSRRARITPEQAGLASFGSRRVKGLRRGEAAQLAGVSVEYYTKLERGDLSGVSESVLDALAQALQLDAAERAHLFDLARAANASPSVRRRRAAAHLVYTAEPGSPSGDALNLLASWAATLDQQEHATEGA